MKKLFYNAYILPLFDYCYTVWGTCNKSHIYKLATLQKRTARIILQVPLKTASVIMFNELAWLSLEDRFQYNIGIQVYKAINKTAPHYYCDLIKKIF